MVLLTAERRCWLQVAILLWQYYKGPRCFIPKVGRQAICLQCKDQPLHGLTSSGNALCCELAPGGQYAAFGCVQRFLPPKYDYHRPAMLPKDRGACSPCDIETGDGAQECVICMCPVETQPCQARMVTPCNHFFHTPCLERWMNVKMECPTCRRVLPPL
jgi:hypothetical protein